MKENFTLAKWLDGTIADEDLAQLKLEEDFLVLEKIKKHSANLQTTGFDPEAMLQSILDAKETVIPIQQQNVSKNPFALFLKIAAVLVIVLGIWLTYDATNPVTYTATNGQQTRFVLPDHSQVILNAGSQITYTKWNWNSNRNLDLKGEAFFKVAKGQKFTVHTALGNVSVLGTQFNVKSRNKRLDVSCFEGKVAVAYSDKIEKITKGQSVTILNNQKVTTTATYQKQPYWLTQKLHFEQARLQDILQEVERQYNITITYNTNISNQLFTGEIPANNIKVALQMISSTYGVSINKKDDKNYQLIESFESK
ncbi:FecR family protein [Flavobacterium sp. FBOR7N2.3]|uniref:FecR family protein n=2 Tax=Flavobacterium TaxID=237 RepID=A0ABV4T816_9FLAO